MYTHGLPLFFPLKASKPPKLTDTKTPIQTIEKQKKATNFASLLGIDGGIQEALCCSGCVADCHFHQRSASGF
jgi:hypothetical protein